MADDFHLYRRERWDHWRATAAPVRAPAVPVRAPASSYRPSLVLKFAIYG